MRFAFFGTSHIAVYCLEALRAAGLTPALIVTPEDRPRGRGLAASPVAVALWAQQHNIPFSHQWDSIDNTYDVAVVVDYGHLLPKHLLETPRRGFLNVHPSLLPRLRGPSPIRTAIRDNEQIVGVSIIVLDEEMDHGPLIAQKRIETPIWPLSASELETLLMREGGILLARVLPEWVLGEIDAHSQNHDVATYTKKIVKEDGLLNLRDDAYKNFLKIRAYEGWPGTYTFFERNGKRLRVGILDAHMENGELIIDLVKPEGKREMPYAEFLRSGAMPI